MAVFAALRCAFLNNMLYCLVDMYFLEMMYYTIILRTPPILLKS